MRFGRIILLLAALAAPFAGAFAQKQQPQDSLVRLLEAQTVTLVDKHGQQYRKAEGHVRFLHNNTYLLCDTAYWNVRSEYIDAYGHVQLAQQGQLLTSDKLHYIIKEDLAQFRGTLVQLTDKEKNTLRTRYLDYNTKDSVAVFRNGGAMKDKDGAVIESSSGTYDTKGSMIHFDKDVEFFSDSLFMKTTKLDYDTSRDIAYFDTNTYLWRDDKFLSAQAGSYDRRNEYISFNKYVYVNDPAYEVWCDTLNYDRGKQMVELLSNAQILDTARKVMLISDRTIAYDDSLSTMKNNVEMTKKPVFLYYGVNEHEEPDSLFAVAEHMLFHTQRHDKVSSSEFNDAEKRVEELMSDPIGTMLQQKAEERQKAEEEKLKKVSATKDRGDVKAAAAADSLAKLGQNGPGADAAPAGPAAAPKGKNLKDDTAAAPKGKGVRGRKGKEAPETAPAVDSVAIAAADSMKLAAVPDSLGKPAMPDSTAVSSLPDSLGVSSLPDSLAVSSAPDSLSTSQDPEQVAPQVDTSDVFFVEARRNVRVFRSDIQVRCDSLVFNTIDSVAQLYQDPVLWNEVTNQLTAKEMKLLIKDEALHRGGLKDNAFLISQHDSLHFNQIKAVEMIGHFKDNELSRFDALGGMTAIFYLVEEGKVTTVNFKEAKMMMSLLKNNQSEKNYYYEGAKNDAYPLIEVDSSRNYLKDFKWRADERPKSRMDLTTTPIRKTNRDYYRRVTFPRFRQTNDYFDGYIKKINREIQVRDSTKRASRLLAQQMKDSLAKAETMALADSLAAAVAAADTIAAVAVPADTIAATAPLEEIVPPVEEIATPVEEIVPPVEEKEIPVEEVAPPVEEITAPPVEEEQKLVEEVAPPVEEIAPPVNEAVTPPVNEAVTPPEEEVETPPTEEEKPVEEVLTPVENFEEFAKETVNEASEVAAVEKERLLTKPERTKQERTKPERKKVDRASKDKSEPQAEQVGQPDQTGEDTPAEEQKPGLFKRFFNWIREVFKRGSLF